MGAYSPYPGPVRWHTGLLVAASPEHVSALRFAVGGQLLSGTGLADARLAHQHHHSAATGQCVLQGRFELAHLALAADEHSARETIR